MMQKVNLKRISAFARHLPKFLVVCVMCGIIFIGGSGTTKSGTSGPDCSTRKFVNKC